MVTNHLKLQFVSRREHTAPQRAQWPQAKYNQNNNLTITPLWPLILKYTITRTVIVSIKVNYLKVIEQVLIQVECIFRKMS